MPPPFSGQSSGIQRASNGRSRLSRFADTVFDVVRRFGSAGVEFVYPPCCPACKVSVPGGSVDAVVRSALCDTCRDEMLQDSRDACRRCGMPLGPYVIAANGCVHCRRRRLAFHQVIRLGLYEDRLRQACIRGKEAGAEPLTAALARLLWETQCRALQEAEIDQVVAVPQYWVQRLLRPHSPAATLATVLARCLKVQFRRNILAKTRLTLDQSSLSSAQRRINLQNAFRARRPNVLSEQTVLLVDDILTTGTTANECSKALRHAGAKRVVVAVAAVVP